MKNQHSPLQLGIVGAGRPNIATSSHLPAAAALKSVRIAALCDTDARGVQRYADEYQARAYTDFDQMLADRAVDAVVICTPDWLHARQTIAAARAGKHVLCEKPVVTNLDELKAVNQVVRGTGVTYMAAHMGRFSLRTRRLCEIVHSGRIGRPVSIRITVKGAYFPYRKDSPYYSASTGGQFLHNGPHYIDQLCALADSEPVRLYAHGRCFDPTGLMQSETYTACLVRFANGVIGSIDQNLTLLDPRGYPTREEVTVIGTRQSVRWCNHVDATTTRYTREGLVMQDPAPIPGDPEDPFVLQLSSFAQAVRTGTTPSYGLKEASRIMHICLGARQSIVSNEAIVLDANE